MVGYLIVVLIETGGEQLVSIHADINGQANNTTINGGRQSLSTEEFLLAR
ncbi:outer membrane protein [Escherichia coli]|uniref:Outer membrane protein n=1 Tax=Escherichia coli TaxID=562 RepID=A0A447X2R5_ECOLX|nr:outer membrane protein [Escherichia coli]